MQLGFEHSYAALPAPFHTSVLPAQVAEPRLLVWNEPLATTLGLDSAVLRPLAHSVFSGRNLPTDAKPIAMAYAGHQFGHFQPALGDGRALLLGELRDEQGVLRDVQLKGSGRTHWSRSGDGLAAVGPMLREYLISEAMHALGIPTTRSLAVVATGTRVPREQPLPGAILTRVAASHVRVGTFEYFAARGDVDSLRTLLAYCIDRHYPEVAGETDRAFAFLQAVADRQASLVAAWISVGFIHGVMNTDNMAISGETIDYGPCAFMDHYDPATVFSSIDHRGRYSFGNQGAIAQWNIARLAECLVPLMPGTTEEAVERATSLVQDFMRHFDDQVLVRMRRKLGLASADAQDATLVRDLLLSMQRARADFTLTFRQLADVIETGNVETPLPEEWLTRWRARVAADLLADTPDATPTNALAMAAPARAAAMRAANPLYIPRNHRVENALTAASERDDLQPFLTLLALAQKPFDEHPDTSVFTRPPADEERVLATFCGT